ncbi:MAG: hypothetical protein KAI61_06040 [Alphaproteobacteria bacterium]|nr:hypothetical protein [Alphaproteobacteria bacterium]
MFYKKRKLPVIAALIVCLLFLSACLPDMRLTRFFTSPVTSGVSQQQAVPLKKASPKSPPLYCMVGRGAFLFGKDWYDFKDAMFSIRQGERASIQITSIRNKKEMVIQVFFDECGQRLLFCPVTDAAPSQLISCASLYALKEDLQHGIKRTFNIPDSVKDGTIACAFIQEKLKSLTAPVGTLYKRP